MTLVPAATFQPPAPMTSPQAKAVMAALGGSVSEPAALFVGGCVRNALMNRPVEDIDIATIWTPPEVTRKLAAMGIKAVPTGIEHGTITAVADGKPFEITTLRCDVSTDGRRAVVAFTKDWQEDSRRRDFTLNTLLADTAGNVFDPTGCGLSDLRAGRVVFVGDPAQRIAEDYLRILRFFRFHATYGSGAPDPAGLVACKVAAEKIRALSRERITQEFFKILALDHAAEILKILFENNVLKDIVDGLYNTHTLNLLCSLQKQHNEPSIMARLAVLCGIQSCHISVLEKYFVFSREQSRLLNSLMTITPGMKSTDEKSIKTLIYRHGHDIAIQSVLLFCAQRNMSPGTFFARVKDWASPTIPVTGEDVMKAGIPSGPRIGKILSALEDWWIENDFTPGRETCMEKMNQLIEGAAR